MSNSFIAACWLVLCELGVWFLDWAEALFLLERAAERAERGVLVGGGTVAGFVVAGAETVERASSMISAISKPTKWFSCCRFDQNFPTSVICLKILLFMSFWVLPM